MQGRGEAIDLTLAREAGRSGPVAAGGFHDEHVGLRVFKARALQQSLIAKRDVARVKQRLLLAAEDDARGAERVAGVVKLEHGRIEAGAGLVVRRPFDLAIVAKA